MKPSHRIYGKHYDKEFVRKHAVLFKEQAEWASNYAKDLMKKPLTLPYFCFESMCFKPFPVRDTFAVNEALAAVKWNLQKYQECMKDIQEQA